MKALIVDDEPHVIAVIKLLVDWKKHGITELYERSNAEDALCLIQEQCPEVILSDIRMPGLSGLELIERIQMLDPAIRTILITAYGDFAYAQKAVQLGCVDYLLKPLTDEGLNAAVAKAVSQYRSQRSLLNESSRRRAQNLLALYLGAEHSPAVMQSLLNSAPFLNGIDRCRMGVICTRHLPGEYAGAYSLANFVHDYFYGLGLGVATIWGTGADIAVLLNAGIGDLISPCTQLMELLECQLGVTLHLGLGPYAAFPHKLNVTFRSARENALSCNLLDLQIRVHTEASPVPSLKVYENMEQVLYPALLSGRPERVRGTVEEFTDSILAGKLLTIRQLENFESSYAGLRTKWIQGFQRERGVSLLSLSAHRLDFCLPDGRFSRRAFVQSLCDDLLAIWSQYLSDGQSAAIGEVFEQVRRYIAENYHAPITLDSLADTFSLSAAYLSRSFKKKFGVGLVDYITHTRITHAKDLLRRSHLRQAEISTAVGFVDPKYFSRVFKRVEGCTPAEYRAAPKAERL
ncbi:response regulator [Oscillibacter sp.]|uniref:response regulator n=1 Tax=Oscillibacter sp. TaxID=1945593 RepID=UPI003395FA58